MRCSSSTKVRNEHHLIYRRKENGYLFTVWRFCRRATIRLFEFVRGFHGVAAPVPYIQIRFRSFNCCRGKFGVSCLELLPDTHLSPRNFTFRAQASHSIASSVAYNRNAQTQRISSASVLLHISRGVKIFIIKCFLKIDSRMHTRRASDYVPVPVVNAGDRRMKKRLFLQIFVDPKNNNVCERQTKEGKSEWAT